MHQHRGLAICLALVTTLAVVSCSNADPPAASAGAAQAVVAVDASVAVPMIEVRTVIDVRTPAEFASGHLVGATNIDVQATDFSARIDSLARNEPYLVYCRSGNRSAIAAEIMARAGFTDIVDAGGFSDLVAAGAPSQ